MHIHLVACSTSDSLISTSVQYGVDLSRASGNERIGCEWEVGGLGPGLRLGAVVEEGSGERQGWGNVRAWWAGGARVDGD